MFPQAINVPVCAVAIAAAVRHMPVDRPTGKARVDLLGGRDPVGDPAAARAAASRSPGCSRSAAAR
jgi:hypothetical protein